MTEFAYSLIVPQSFGGRGRPALARSGSSGSHDVILTIVLPRRPSTLQLSASNRAKRLPSTNCLRFVMGAHLKIEKYNSRIMRECWETK